MSGSCKGQWLLIFAVIFSFTVLILSIALNEAMKSGYEVSRGLTELPYYEVRALIHEIARSYKNGDWEDNKTLEEDLAKIFARHGYLLDIDICKGQNYIEINGSLEKNNIIIKFNNKKIG